MTVVIGYIPDEYGEAALQLGLQEAETRQHACGGRQRHTRRRLRRQAVRRRAGLTDLDERLTAAGVDHRVHQAVGVDVGEEIVRVAEVNHAELVVIGIRPRSPVGKVMMGSVAQTVIMDAPCPVLTVRPDCCSKLTMSRRAARLRRPRHEDHTRHFSRGPRLARRPRDTRWPRSSGGSTKGAARPPAAVGLVQKRRPRSRQHPLLAAPRPGRASHRARRGRGLGTTTRRRPRPRSSPASWRRGCLTREGPAGSRPKRRRAGGRNTGAPPHRFHQPGAASAASPRALRDVGVRRHEAGDDSAAGAAGSSSQASSSSSSVGCPARTWCSQKWGLSRTWPSRPSMDQADGKRAGAQLCFVEPPDERAHLVSLGLEPVEDLARSVVCGLHAWDVGAAPPVSTW